MATTSNPALPVLHVGRSAQYSALTLFPVWADGGAATGLEWDLGTLDIGERDGGGQVNSLTAVNAGDKPVVLLEGDLLEGGWQTRMVARSTILGPHQTANLAALCVEQGRWERGGKRGHRAGGRRVSTSLRAARDRAYRHGEDAQHAVWHGIASRYETTARTASHSFADHLDRVARERSQRRERPLPAKPLAGQRGGHHRYRRPGARSGAVGNARRTRHTLGRHHRGGSLRRRWRCGGRDSRSAGA